MAKTKATKAKAAVAKVCERCRDRTKLIRWAELCEALAAFEDLLGRVADDDVLDDVSVGNIEDCLRCLRGELSSAVPVEW